MSKLTQRNRFIIGMVIALILVGYIIVIGSIASCTSFQSKPAYIAFARDYTTISKQYNDAYDRANAATKAKWHKEIDPALNAVDAALDAWRDSLGSSTAEVKKATLDRSFAALLSLLQQYKIVEVKK